MRNSDAPVVGEKVRDDLDSLRSDLKALRDDFLSLKDHGMEGARAAAKRTGRYVTEAAHRAGDYGRDARDQMEGHIVERPFTSVGVALGVGMLMGALIGRMR